MRQPRSRACFRGAINFWICSRVKRAAKVGEHPAGLEDGRLVLVDVVHEEDAVAQPGEEPVHGRSVEAVPGRRGGPLQPFEHAFLVALGLQPAQEPGAGVGQPLVVEVDRVLRGQHDPQAKRPRLLEQGQHRRLRRRVPRGWEVAEDLVHVEHGAQARRPRLGPDPGQNLVQQDRDEEHPLAVREVGDRQDRHARLPFAGVQEAADIERLALHPGGEAGRGDEVVQLECQGEPLLGREEGLQVDHADLVEWRRLHGVDHAGEVKVAAGAPGLVQEIGQQDVLAAGDGVGVDAQEGQAAPTRPR